MTATYLKVIVIKTEIIVTSNNGSKKHYKALVGIGGRNIYPVKIITNLGVCFDKKHNFCAQINSAYGSAFFLY